MILNGELEIIRLNSFRCTDIVAGNCFSESLIIHQVKTKNPLLISLNFDDFTSLFTP